MTNQLSIFIPVERNGNDRDKLFSDLLLTEVFQGLFDSVVWSSDLRDLTLSTRPFVSLVEALSSPDRCIDNEWTPTSGIEHAGDEITPLVSGVGSGPTCVALIDSVAPRALPEQQRGVITTQVAAILLSGGRGLSLDLRCFLSSEHEPDLNDFDTLASRIVAQIDDPDSFAYHFYNGLLTLAPGFASLRVRSHTRTDQEPGVYSARIGVYDSTDALWFIANTNRNAGGAGISRDRIDTSSDDEPTLFRDLLSDDLVYPHHDASGELTLELEGYETVLLRREPI